MKRFTMILFVLVALPLFWQPGGEDTGDGFDNHVIFAQESEKRCGDGICDGPENTSNCPVDCAAAQQQTVSATSSSLCDNPNPQRAIVSSELLTFGNVVEDSSFEEGNTDIVLFAHHNPDLTLATAARTAQAAHAGGWGYEIAAGPNQGATFAVKAYIEKGEELRFSAWVRAPSGQLTLTPQVFWVENPNNVGIPTRGRAVMVGPEWTHIEFTLTTTTGTDYAMLAFAVGPESTLYIDDVEIAVPFWRMAEYAPGQGREVGGVTVPAAPAAPTHFNIIIHIEDPNLLHNSRAYFEEQTAIFTELARIIHEHGGFLTIQPEQDWPQAAEERFHPGLLTELARNYGVVFSNHTHGPNCLDPGGVPRSAADCSSNRDWPRSTSADDVVTYAQTMRELLSAASGTQVTDHNGNFDFTASSRLAEAGIQTLSAFKDRTTQGSYDRLINNPWRPGQGSALEDINNFLTHTPATEVVYVPGWGQALTRHPQRVSDRIRPMLSQFIRFADPQRINSFYVVTHVGHFYSRTGDPGYLSFNEQTGQVTYSVEFQEHLGYWDAMLSDVVDPLVEGGYLRWASIPEIGALYREWEQQCTPE